MALTEKNREIVNDFYALRKEIDGRILVHGGEKRYLENYLALTYGPIFNYTEAIVILCENGKYNAAHVLMRCLFEAHINVVYHQLGDSKKRLAISARKQLQSRIATTLGLLKVIENYPNHASSVEDELMNPIFLKGKFDTDTKAIEELGRANDLKGTDKNQNLKSKALDCDNFKVKGADPGHFQLMYEMVYRYLSPYVHLDLQGLQSFFNKDTEGNLRFSENNSEDLLIGQSVDIAVSLVKDLYDNGVITAPRPAVLGKLDRTQQVVPV